jgi:RAB protein geranylgeranyltransferase component A
MCPPKTFRPISTFYVIQDGRHAIESDLEAILFNLVPLVTQKRSVFKLLRWTRNLHQSEWGHESMYADKY